MATAYHLKIGASPVHTRQENRVYAVTCWLADVTKPLDRLWLARSRMNRQDMRVGLLAGVWDKNLSI